MSTADRRDFRVAILGAGFGGLGMAIRLKQAGMHDFVVLERGEEVGGTWWANTYPGCQCDVPSHLYKLLVRAEPELDSDLPAPARDPRLPARPHLSLRRAGASAPELHRSSEPTGTTTRASGDLDTITPARSRPAWWLPLRDR